MKKKIIFAFLATTVAVLGGIGWYYDPLDLINA